MGRGASELRRMAEEDPEEARRLILRALDQEAGASAPAAKRFGLTRDAFRKIQVGLGLPTAQREARERAYSRFRLL